MAICIIGAGPAGVTTALFLAKAGIPHILLDAAVFPRDKICGDGLDLKVTRVLRQLDPGLQAADLFAGEAFLESWGTRFITQNGRISEFIYTPGAQDPNPYPLFHLAKRLHFDHFLIQKINPAYTDFRSGHTVEGIERDGNTWRIFGRHESGTFDIRAQYIVGADGDHSVVLRSLGERSIDKQHYAGSLRQYWRGVAGLHEKNLIEVYFPKGLPMSYFYIFPLPNGEANVGYGMVSALVSKHKHNLREIFARLIQEDPLLALRFREAVPLEKPVGWGIPLASRRRKAFGDGYLLVGDAASLVCPTSGEGIGTGMVSGYIAACFLEKALQAGRRDADFFKNYDREIYRRLESEIKLYRLMMGIGPGIYDFGLNLLAPNPLFKWSFHKRAPGWLQTAYEKEIAVNF